VNILAGYSDPGPPETWYVKSQYGINGSSAVGSHTEWDGDGRIMYVDDLWPTQGSMTNNDLVDCYNVWLQAGVAVTLNFSSTSIYIAAQVFENPGGGSNWVNDADVLTPVNGVIFPQTTGWHGVVITHGRNDGGGTYTSRSSDARTRPPSPTTSRCAPRPGRVLLLQPAGHVLDCGRHPLGQLASRLGSLGVPERREARPPTASPGLSTSSAGARNDRSRGGRLNLPGNAVGIGITRIPIATNGESDAWTEWDGGADQIVVGNPFTHTALSDSGLCACWDVFLSAGQQYTIEFLHDAGIDAKVLLFQSHNAPYWADRSSAMLQSSTTTTFTAPANDFYGLVVVNDRGSGGTDVRILPPNVGVSPPGGPAITALTNAGPTPSRGPLAGV
jgi:hypothetical protein